MGFYLQRIRNVQPSKAEKWWEMWHIKFTISFNPYMVFMKLLETEKITSRKTHWNFEISEDVAAFFEKPNANDTTNISVST